MDNHFEMTGINYRTDLSTIKLLREQVKALEDGDDGRIEVIAAMMSLGLKAGRIVRLR